VEIISRMIFSKLGVGFTGVDSLVVIGPALSNVKRIVLILVVDDVFDAATVAVCGDHAGK